MKTRPSNNGRVKTRAYRAWVGILLRCSSTHKAHFGKYKGRGIFVHDEWLDFDNFLRDMGHPQDGMSIDRIDNNGPYCAANCRWADSVTQSRNRRSVRPITLNGKTMLLTDWSRSLGINISTLSMRLDQYKWSVEKALTTELQNGKNRN